MTLSDWRALQSLTRDVQWSVSYHPRTDYKVRIMEVDEEGRHKDSMRIGVGRNKNLDVALKEAWDDFKTSRDAA